MEMSPAAPIIIAAIPIGIKIWVRDATENKKLVGIKNQVRWIYNLFACHYTDTISDDSAQPNAQTRL